MKKNRTAAPTRKFYVHTPLSLGQIPLCKRVKTPAGFVKIRSSQYKIYEFIDRHFKGNVSEAARHLGMSQPQLAYIIDKGVFGRKVATRIIESFSRLEKGVTYKSLFIEPSFEKIPVRIVPNLPKPILPRRGDVKALGLSVFSRMLDKHK